MPKYRWLVRGDIEGAALGPSLAAWAEVLVETLLRTACMSLQVAASRFGSSLYVHGMFALNQGFMLSSMVLSAILVFAIDHELANAAGWAAGAALLSFFGLIHAHTLASSGPHQQARLGGRTKARARLRHHGGGAVRPAPAPAQGRRKGPSGGVARSRRPRASSKRDAGRQHQ
jgi:hypothetical protein